MHTFSCRSKCKDDWLAHENTNLYMHKPTFEVEGITSTCA